MRTRLLEILEGAGHELLVGEDGIDAVWLFKHHRPDCALLDIDMPLMSGIEAVTKIIAIDPAAKIAMVTGERDESTVLHALTAGAIDYIGKPFEHDRVLATVEKLLGKAATQAA